MVLLLTERYFLASSGSNNSSLSFCCWPAGLKGPQRLTLLLNPQWSTTGQVVSDFG